MLPAVSRGRLRGAAALTKTAEKDVLNHIFLQSFQTQCWSQSLLTCSQVHCTPPSADHLGGES